MSQQKHYTSNEIIEKATPELLSPVNQEELPLNLEIIKQMHSIIICTFNRVKQLQWNYNILYILLWYFFSTSLSIYNKTVMSKDNFNLNLPLLMSAVHSGIHTLMTRFLVAMYNQKISSYSRLDYSLKVVPCGIASAVEICCANASLVLITLSSYTIIKSTTAVWVLLFSFLFGFEKPRLNLIVVIFIIVFGVLLTIEGQPQQQFNPRGSFLVLSSAIASGLRWNMTQFLMKKKSVNDQQQSPLSTMYHLSPVMFATMLTLSLIIEKPFDSSHHHNQAHFDSLISSMVSILIMSVGGVLAFIMVLAELYLVKGTSTVTLSVAGISKEIIVISLSVLIYGDVLTLKTCIGLFVSILGIAGYNYYQHQTNKQKVVKIKGYTSKEHLE